MSRYSSKYHGVCNECNSNQLVIDYETREIVCQNCGFVMSSTQLSQEPEWRAFNNIERDKLPRVGAPITWTIHDQGLSTTIGWQNKDAQGKNLSPENRSNIYRLRKWQRRSKLSESSQRNLSHALGDISKIGNKLNLPKNVIETSSIIYRKALRKNLIRGRTIQSVAVACIYMACRQCGVIRTLNDVANATNITKNEAAKNYRFLLKELKPSIPLVNPSGYISSIVSKLKLRGDTESLALRVLSIAANQKLTNGRGPGGMAAACVYISSQLTGERLTQAKIAKEAQVTEVTIRNRYKELANRIDFNIIL